VKLFRHPGFTKNTNAVCEETEADIEDPLFVRSAIIAILRSIAPAYNIPDRFVFQVIDTDDGYAISGTLDFDTIGKAALPPFTNGLTAAHMLGFIQEARADTFFAAHYMADMVTTSLSSELIRLKHYEWLRRSDVSRNEIEAFSEISCNNMPSIREAIKSWLQEANTDEGLVTAYINETTKNTWADKLPYKLIKLTFFQAIGLLVEAKMPTGLAMSAAWAASAGDPLLIERFIKGWRPSHFINGAYKKFVSVAV
jgi:hypothetical protein